MDMAQVQVTHKELVASITKKVIDSNGLTPSRFAQDLGTDRQRVHQWTRAQTIPNTVIIAEALKQGRESPGKEHLAEWARLILDGLGGTKQ